MLDEGGGWRAERGNKWDEDWLVRVWGRSEVRG